jgi:hypothetical protein
MKSRMLFVICSVLAVGSLAQANTRSDVSPMAAKRIQKEVRHELRAGSGAVQCVRGRPSGVRSGAAHFMSVLRSASQISSHYHSPRQCWPNRN